jgi:hypothetical protein
VLVQDVIARSRKVCLIGEDLIDHIESGRWHAGARSAERNAGLLRPARGAGLISVRRSSGRYRDAGCRQECFIESHLLFPLWFDLVGVRLRRAVAKFDSINANAHRVPNKQGHEILLLAGHRSRLKRCARKILRDGDMRTQRG